MGHNAAIGSYLRAVRSVFRERLASRGFKLKQDRRYRYLIAESESCRIFFDPHQFILYVQRVSNTPQELSPAYDLNFLLKALDTDLEFNINLLQGHNSIRAEVDRMVCLLLEHCQPILNGDDTAWNLVLELVKEEENEAIARMDKLGLRLKDGKEWRMLPELDSVRVNGASKPLNVLQALLLLIIPGGYTLFLIVAYCVALFGPPQKDTFLMLFFFTVCGIPMIILDVWIVRKVLLCQYYWKTSKKGLTIGMFLKNLFIPWEDVEAALLLPKRRYEIRTEKRTLRLERGAQESISLEASIWQHLQRLGKATITPLSMFAISLWAQIPDDASEEIQWESPKPPYFLDIILKLTALETLIWGIVFFFKLEIALPLFVISTFPVWRALYDLILIQSISISDDRIVALTALGTFNISWSDVQSIKFFGGYGGRCMIIRAGTLCFIRVPWFPKHPNSTRILLAITKRLRQEERFKLLPFPAVLLAEAYSGDVDSE